VILHVKCRNFCPTITVMDRVDKSKLKSTASNFLNIHITGFEFRGLTDRSGAFVQIFNYQCDKTRGNTYII
jgi:hypothetical protein